MPSFGIIAEGVTDPIVLEAVLAGYFGDDDPDVAYIQPPVDATGRGPAVRNAGWGMVFKHFETGEYAKALDYRDYLVVQIDTDVSEQKGYDVPWRDGARELPPEELVGRVVERLRRLVGDEAFAKHQRRLIFAVSVHSVECWLLPLLYTDNKRGKITGCSEAANKALARAAKDKLSNAAGEKFPRAYRDAARAFEKRSVVVGAAKHNASFAAFLAALDARFSTEAPA